MKPSYKFVIGLILFQTLPRPLYSKEFVSMPMHAVPSQGHIPLIYDSPCPWQSVKHSYLNHLGLSLDKFKSDLKTSFFKNRAPAATTTKTFSVAEGGKLNLGSNDSKFFTQPFIRRQKASLSMEPNVGVELGYSWVFGR